jgi:uncharacterized Ntn-hydrolase superfamily protein
MKPLKAFLLLVVFAVPCLAQIPAPINEPWFSTFSIIAFEPATKEFGVGVQSRAFGSGAAVPYAKPGVGAVATQASANRQYGPKAIALLEQGLSPAEVVKRVTDEDEERDTRQVAVIDAQGRSAVYTGKNVIDRNHNPQDLVHYGGYAGHVTGTNFSAQGNTLASEEVVKAMASAYESTKGTMADRLMAALEAGQSKGGDTRGMQSAGILVVRPLDPANPAANRSYVERVVDLQVDDAVNGNPFKELRRLLDISQRKHIQLADQSTKLAAEGKFAEAIAEQKKAIEIDPNRETLHYGLAQRYAQAGDLTKAIQALEIAIKIHPVSMKREAAADPIFAKLKDNTKFKRLVSQSRAASD